MTEIGFYHLTRSKLEQALPRLLEKVLESGARAVVRAGSDERIRFLNTNLWTYDQDTFLPHGSAAEGEAAHQPIWLTTEQENPNLLKQKRKIRSHGGHSAACRPSAVCRSTDTSWLTPRSPMVTPNKRSMRAMVKR